MNILLKNCAFLILLSLLLLSNESLAKSAEKALKIKIKCHVELVGGKDIVHFGVIKTERLTKYSQWLIGKKIATGFSKQKQQVYKVKECVKSQEDFSSASSQQLDENTAR